jgi:metal-sulfur cluster biosynthetic enzyme
MTDDPIDRDPIDRDPIDRDAVHQAALTALRDVWDPELGLDVVSLGLVYGIEVVDGSVLVDMTLTTPGCPVAESLPTEARDALQRALPEHRIEVRVVWDPPWTPERLSEEALDALGYRR